MYFTEQEQQMLAEIMIEQGIDPKTVLYVKKRGRMFIKVQGRNDDFAFLSKKAVSLDANGQWANRVDYFVGATKADKQITWEGLLDAFAEWLKTA